MDPEHEGDPMKTMAVALLALALPVQVPKEPAKDLVMHSATVPGVEIRFVDYDWQPELFEAMEHSLKAFLPRDFSGFPDEKRNWVVARVILDERPLSLGTARLPVGNYALVLWPNIVGSGMAIEMRRVDMREVYPDVNAIAPAPRGETIFKGPVKFESGNPLAPRLDIQAGSEAGRVSLTVRYGDRRLVVTFVR
jgi:hypothetical protein